jgi:glycosyltransferase involved in cell wall biosynthesis
MRVITQYARWLRAQGHEVRIAHPAGYVHAPRRGFRALVTNTRELLGKVRPKPTHFDGLDVERIVLPAGHVPTDNELPDADVVVATWWETAEWLARLAPSKGAKTYFVQGHEVFDFLPKQRVRATYRLPVHIITVSEWLRQTLRREYGAADVSLVHNGVDSTQFHSPERARQATFTVGMVYSHHEFKGCDIGIEAVRIAARKIPGLRFVVFGTADAPLSGLPLPKFAEYFPRPAQSDIPKLYARCDAWLFSSREEGFGLPILEAMACRTPVIATPAGAAPDLLAGGGGLLVPPDDPAAMAAAIEHIWCGSATSWAELSNLAWSTAQKHTLEQASQAFEAALRRAAGTSSQPWTIPPTESVL